MAKSPQSIADKQVRRAQGAVQDLVEGVQAVTESPGARAVKKKDKLKNNFNAAVDSGKWEQNTAAVSLDEWKDTTVKKVNERYASGVEAARPKIEAFHADLQQYLQSTKAQIDSMPDATPEQRDQKMLANVRRMRQFKRTRRRR